MNKIHSCIVVAYDNILVFSTPIHHQNIEKIDRNAHVYVIRWSIQLIWLVRLLLYVLGSRTNKRMIFRVPHTSCAPIPFPMASDLFGRILKKKNGKKKTNAHWDVPTSTRCVVFILFSSSLLFKYAWPEKSTYHQKDRHTDK